MLPINRVFPRAHPLQLIDTQGRKRVRDIVIESEREREREREREIERER